MPMPKSKISRSRRGQRRSHDSLSRPKVENCETTGELHRPHRAYKSADGVWYFKGEPITAAKESAEAQA